MAELKEDKLVVPADKSTANKKVKVEYCYMGYRKLEFFYRLR